MEQLLEGQFKRKSPPGKYKYCDIQQGFTETYPDATIASCITKDSFDKIL